MVLEKMLLLHLTRSTTCVLECMEVGGLSKPAGRQTGQTWTLPRQLPNAHALTMQMAIKHFEVFLHDYIA